MMVLAAALTTVLLLVAALHVAWGIGLWIPLTDEAALTRAAVGQRGRVTMPGAVPCALVAVALIAAAWLPWWAPGALRTAGLAGCAAVFLARGTLAYTAAWRRRVPAEPFATLDRRAYGPLCLALGAGFLALALAG
jgi:hypothetical protein